MDLNFNKPERCSSAPLTTLSSHSPRLTILPRVETAILSASRALTPTRPESSSLRVEVESTTESLFDTHISPIVASYKAARERKYDSTRNSNNKSEDEFSFTWPSNIERRKSFGGSSTSGSPQRRSREASISQSRDLSPIRRRLSTESQVSGPGIVNGNSPEKYSDSPSRRSLNGRISNISNFSLSPVSDRKHETKSIEKSEILKIDDIKDQGVILGNVIKALENVALKDYCLDMVLLSKEIECPNDIRRWYRFDCGLNWFYVRINRMPTSDSESESEDSVGDNRGDPTPVARSSSLRSLSDPEDQEATEQTSGSPVVAPNMTPPPL